MFIMQITYFINAFLSQSLIQLVYSEHMLSICTYVAYAEISSGVEFTYTQHMLYVRRGSKFKVRPTSRSRPTPRKFRPLPSCDPENDFVLLRESDDVAS